MKHASPEITIVENEDDVLTYRMATGDVVDVGDAIMKGVIYASPLGIRRYGEKDGKDGILRMCEALCEYITGYEIEVEYKKTNGKKK